MNHRLRLLPARADRISLSLGLSLRKYPAIRISTNHRGLGLEGGKPLLAPENLPSPIPFSRSAMEGLSACAVGLSKVAYLCRGEGSALERGNPRYAGGMRIELITTGSELLLGQVLNSHPGYLSGRLAMLGLELARQTAVPDGREAILEVLAEAWKRADLNIS